MRSVPTIIAAAVLCAGIVYGPDMTRGAYAWLYPTPEERAAQEKAHEERAAQAAAAVQADAQRRKDEVNSHLTEHPGCKFEDLGGYSLNTSDGPKRYPIFAIFCPTEQVTTETVWDEKVRSGKTTHVVEHPTSVTTDPTAEEQPQ